MYDGNGRLIGVVDSTSRRADEQNVAVYNGVTAGNLVTITTRSSTAASDTSIIG